MVQAHLASERPAQVIQRPLEQLFCDGLACKGWKQEGTLMIARSARCFTLRGGWSNYKLVGEYHA
jgi:hypothetical protein